mmetsp:Transcript_32694/g.57895  ORF Transcript_32694/g.57895 Transcript_32694/m.57895 type:complete len:99 (-) Transcript_32694:145-441(-)
MGAGGAVQGHAVEMKGSTGETTLSCAGDAGDTRPPKRSSGVRRSSSRVEMRVRNYAEARRKFSVEAGEAESLDYKSGRSSSKETPRRSKKSESSEVGS